MDKFFLITKNTPVCQRLVRQWYYTKPTTEELTIRREIILSMIREIVMPKAAQIMADECNKTPTKDKDMDKINKFLNESLLYYLNEYNPQHNNGRKYPAHFETYYITNLKFKIPIFLAMLDVEEKLIEKD